MKLKSTILTLIITLSISLAFSQDMTKTNSTSVQKEEQGLNHRNSIGSTLFLMGNLDSGKPVNFLQLNYGYKLTAKDNIVVEAITWTYYEPLGTYNDSDEFYPGKIRAYGVGVGYQRFHWKNAYTTVEATPFLQQFYSEGDKKIQKGFQLYLQGIAGYRFEFCIKRLFVEPAIAIKYWPVNTNFPDSFAAIESGKPKYKFEPGANFGFKF